MVAFVWSHSPLRGRRLRPVRHFEGASPGWRNRKIGIFWVMMLQTGDGVASVLVPDSFASSSIIGLTDSSGRIVGERVAESLGGGQPGAFSLARSVSALTFFCWGTRRADSRCAPPHWSFGRVRAASERRAERPAWRRRAVRVVHLG